MFVCSLPPKDASPGSPTAGAELVFSNRMATGSLWDWNAPSLMLSLRRQTGNQTAVQPDRVRAPPTVQEAWHKLPEPRGGFWGPGRRLVASCTPKASQRLGIWRHLLGKRVPGGIKKPGEIIKTNKQTNFLWRLTLSWKPIKCQPSLCSQSNSCYSDECNWK